MTICISGRLVGNPKISETAKGKPMVRVLVEIEEMRPVGRGEYRLELHSIPVVSYGWCAQELATLRPGAAVVLLCHLNGTKYEQPGQETKHGLQLVVNSVSYPAAFRAPVKELTPPNSI
jgi:single-stranded DNA-binding protein